MKINLRILIAITLTMFFVLACGTKTKNAESSPVPDEKIEEIEIDGDGESDDGNPVNDVSAGNEDDGKSETDNNDIKNKNKNKNKNKKNKDETGDEDEAPVSKYEIGSGVGTLEQAFCSESLAYKNELFTVSYADFNSICVLEAAADCSRPIQDLCLEAPGGSRYPDELKAFPGSSFKVMSGLNRGTSLGSDSRCTCPSDPN